MEQKDKVYLKGKLKEEYEQIVRMEFWQDYIKRIKQERDIAVSHCVTDPTEDVPRYQGAIRSLDIVLGLPNKILEITPLKFL